MYIYIHYIILNSNLLKQKEEGKRSQIEKVVND